MQKCNILAKYANFLQISIEKFKTLSLAEKHFNKITIFISTHAETDDFISKCQFLDKIISLWKLLDTIETIVSENSELIIFDSSCFSFEHAEFAKTTNYFSKLQTAIYVGGTCPMSKHGSTIVKSTGNLICENLIEPILQNWEYDVDRTDQRFETFADSILNVKTFEDLGKLEYTSQCTKKNHKTCKHFQTHVLQGNDLSISDWFGFTDDQTPKFFLQFFGHQKFEYWGITTWGYVVWLENKKEKELLYQIFNPTTIENITFEVLNISTWDHTTYLTFPGNKFHELNCPNPNQFPQQCLYFTEFIPSSIFSRLHKYTHLFRVSIVRY